MIRPIMRDMFFLSRKSSDAGPEDLPVVMDLLDTLSAHKSECVGMAANMIGVSKRIIAFDHGGSYMVMMNPEIISRTGPYETQEGCLSLEGIRPTTRYQTIKVKYLDTSLRQKVSHFTGWTAQIIQHEIDHCNGIII